MTVVKYSVCVCVRARMKTLLLALKVAKNTVFRDVTPCSLVDIYRRFGRCFLHFQYKRLICLDVKANLPLETSVNLYLFTWRHIPEDGKKVIPLQASRISRHS